MGDFEEYCVNCVHRSGDRCVVHGVFECFYFGSLFGYEHHGRASPPLRSFKPRPEEG